MTFLKFLTLLILILQIFNVKTNEQTKEASTTITLTNTNETSKIEFSNGQLLIWPENCILNVKNHQNEIIDTGRNLITINSSEITSVNISVNKTDSGQNDTCRFHYVNYNELNTISLVDTGTFRFDTYENLSLEFDAFDYTNPAYYLSINKLGSGNLTFNIQNESDSNSISKEFKITDSDPFKGIYINRKNLFEKCVDEEPYECSITIKVIGKNIPFEILIRNAHNNSVATYLKPNEMILGVAEAFNPLYFFTEIPKGSEGEVFINYKRGGMIAYKKIIPKENNGIVREGISNNNFDFDYYHKKISFDSSSCENDNGCEIFIGLFVNDYQLDDPDEFSIFLKYNDSNKDSVKIFPNEYVFGTLYSTNESDSYNISIPTAITTLNFIFENDYCNLSIKDNQSNDVEYNCKREFCEISSLSEKDTLKFIITPQLNLSSFYSLKVTIPDNLSTQKITSERTEYCYINDRNKNNICYFIFPIKEYERTTNVSFYAINYEYPKNFKANLTVYQIDISSYNLNGIDGLEFLGM